MESKIQLTHLDEQRAQNLFTKLKCITCTGENIKESQSNFAIMLRKDINTYLVEGLDDQQIMTKLTQIYGEDILMTSSPEYSGLVMWSIPLIIVIFGLLKINKLISYRSTSKLK